LAMAGHGPGMGRGLDHANEGVSCALNREC
jgi:hypothetical protein